MKKNATRISAWLLTILLVFSLTACGKSEPFTPAPAGNDISLLPEEEAKYMADEDVNRANRYARGTEELSCPAPVTLSWTAGKKAPVSYQVAVSESSDMSAARVFATKELSVEVYNCKIGTTYYWTVTGTMADGSEVTGEVQQFTTSSQGPRNIYCDGITNMRDCGGWQTADGKTVNQGLLYRCGRLNANTVTTVTPEITENGIKTMQELGIRTEIDLRRVDNNEVGGLTDTSVLPGVQYIQCPMGGDVGHIRAGNDEMVCKVFDVLSDKNNYPIIFHCSIGTDRTGYVAYLALGLLGVPEETLERDYLLSNFGVINGTRGLNRITDDYVNIIAGYPGAALSDKVEAYLLALGVEQSEIDSFRSIMLG